MSQHWSESESLYLIDGEKKRPLFAKQCDKDLQSRKAEHERKGGAGERGRKEPRSNLPIGGRDVAGGRRA